MYNVIPEYFLFMGKYELLRWPLFNMFFKDMNIAVNRGSHVEAAKAFRRAANALDRGTSLALFPEGTIPVFTPRLKPFKDGAFKLAIEKQVPIVPGYVPGPLAFVRRADRPVEPWPPGVR